MLSPPHAINVEVLYFSLSSYDQFPFISYVNVHLFKFVIGFILIFFFNIYFLCIIKRPGVAGAVLQTSLSLIHWSSKSSYVNISSTNLYSQADIARELKLYEKVNLPPPLPCHVSHVMCGMLHVTCLMSHFTCHIFCEACQGRVCDQRGLPQLVFIFSIAFVCLFVIKTNSV